MKLQLLNIIRIVDDENINEINHLKDLGFRIIGEEEKVDKGKGKK